MNQVLQSYLSEYPLEVRDLTSGVQNDKILEIADKLLLEHSTNIEELDIAICSNTNYVKKISPLFLEAVKIAISKQLLHKCKAQTHTTVVWAMYNETKRLQPKSNSNTYGEDSLREKVKQLKWLYSNSKSTWSLILCDDGCPEKPNSGKIAQQIIDNENYNEFVKVIFLQDAIDNKLPVTNNFKALTNTSESRKGGSICYAMYEALHCFKQNKKHIILYTDADLSANMGLAGSLIYPLVNQNKNITLGQRYGVELSIIVKETGATVEPDSTKEQVGKILILFRHFVRVVLIPQLEHVLDTQAGFKAMTSETAKSVLPLIKDFKELFDIELLINVANKFGKNSLENVPILFTEDFAMTNFPSLKPGEGHLNMIKQIIDIYDSYQAKKAPAPKEFVALFKNLDLEKFQALIEKIKQLDKDDDTLFDRRWSLEQLAG